MGAMFFQGHTSLDNNDATTIFNTGFQQEKCIKILSGNNLMILFRVSIKIKLFSFLVQIF